MSPDDLVVYVDVDDTLVRSVGAKRIPITGAIEHVRQLHRDGAQMYCWSSGGATYARASAIELGLDGCFVGYLPKPHVLLDDQHPSAWRRLVHVHPAQAGNESAAQYAARVEGTVG